MGWLPYSSLIYCFGSAVMASLSGPVTLRLAWDLLFVLNPMSHKKRTCHRHRAQLNGEVSHSSADATGLGGHCCARHGCFAPGSMVDFQKGEKQMNMDWSFCEALSTTNIGELLRILHIYDITCQYCVHLKERIERNPHLSIPDQLQLLHAIGLFHVHGHKDECLYRWATSYVPGAGCIDGEVLETLWAVLNTVSASTRTASLAHRTEILDDHMGDSNFKKMINIGEQQPIKLPEYHLFYM